MIAKFMGIVNLPLFSTPYSLPFSSDYSDGVSKKFKRNCFAPAFIYNDRRPATFSDTVSRLVSLVPNITGVSRVVANPTLSTVGQIGFFGNGAGWIDDRLHLQYQDGSGPGSGDWLMINQTRQPGVLDVASQSPFNHGPYDAGFSTSGKNFYNEVAPFILGGGHTGGGKLMTDSSHYANVFFYFRSRLMATPDTFAAFQMDIRFSSSNYATWTSGREPAVMGTPSMVYCLYPPRTLPGPAEKAKILGFIPQQFAGFNTAPNAATYFLDVELDNPTLNALFQNDTVSVTAGFSVWKNGFIVRLFTNGTGPTGQPFEIIVFNAPCDQYYLVRFIAQNAAAGRALTTTTNPWNFKIDTNGIAWFYSGIDGFADEDNLFYSFSPNLVWNPTYFGVNIPPIILPCFNPCPQWPLVTGPN